MGKRKINYMVIVLSVVQVLLLALPFVFEYLTKKKPLVMRHIYTRKLEHLSTILDASYRNLYAAIVIILAAIFLFVLIKNANIKVKDFIGNWILASILVSMLSFDLFSSKMTYTYDIGILLIVWTIDLIKLHVKVNFARRYRMFT